MPFDLSAKTSIILVIKVTTKNVTLSSNSIIRKTREADGPCSFTIFITYSYDCKTKITKTSAIYLKRICSEDGKIEFDNDITTIGGFYIFGDKVWHVSILNFLDVCDNSGDGGNSGGNSGGNGNDDKPKDKPSCLQAIYSCLLDIMGDIVKIKGKRKVNRKVIIPLINFDNKGIKIVDNFGHKSKRSAGGIVRIGLLFIKYGPTILECSTDIYDSCLKSNPLRLKRSTNNNIINIYSPFLYKQDLAPVLAESLIAIKNLYELLAQTYGDGNEIITDKEPIVGELILQFQSESSDAGKYISLNEYKQLENVTAPDTLKHFIERLNNTIIISHNPNGTINITNYINMTLLKEKYDHYNSDLKRANLYGFESIMTWLEETAKFFDQAPIKKGVCARVLIRLSQQLVLTREIFEAELQMLNSEEIDLTNIKIILNVKRANDSKIVSYHFHVNDPILSSFSSIDGKGVLKAGDTGEAKWLLTPTKQAAPIHPVDYKVDGYVAYKMNNVDFKIDLGPEKITVKPDPSLILLYFLEKYVQSDDPLTDFIEPTIPFVLGLLVINNGHGVAKNLRIQTSQPEIIENESGLLIDFNIISFYLNNMLEMSTLNINFGDVQPFEVKHGIWLLESSLKGTFSRLNATLVSDDRDGNKQLSLIDRVEYRELLKTVRLFDDELVDFLVIDKASYKVYSSNQPLSPLDVIYVRNSTIIDIDLVKYLIRIRLELSQSGWFLSQMKLSNVYLNGYYLLDTKREENKVLSRENVWLNQFTDGNTWILSIFDYNPDGARSVEYDIELTKNSNLLMTTKPKKETTKYSIKTFNNDSTSAIKTQKNITTVLIQSSVITLTFSSILNKIWKYVLGITLICLICISMVGLVCCKCCCSSKKEGPKRHHKAHQERTIDPREQRKFIN